MVLTEDTEKSLLISPEKSKEESSMKKGKELSRSLGFWYVFSYVVGIIFGSGILISPGLVAKQTQNMGIGLVIWMISGIMCIFGGLCFCELASALRKVGGEYIFVKETLGDIAGFCTIWAEMLVVFPTSLAILSVAIAEYLLGPFCDLSSSSATYWVKMIAVSILVLSTCINFTSTSFVGKSQVFFTAIQMLTVVFFIFLGIWKVSTGSTQNYSSMFNDSGKSTVGGVSLALYNGLWAYDGWGMICTVTEELRNPDQDLWLAVVTGIPFVIFCYLLVNLAFMSVLTHSEMSRSSTVATTFSEKILGKKVALIVPVAAALSCFSSVNATVLIYSRSLLSASREGHLPEPLSYIHADRRTPVPALVYLCMLTIIWILVLGSESQMLLVFYSLAVWLAYGAGILCVIVLRIRQPKIKRPLKVNILNPILMTLISLFLVIAPFFKSPVESCICCASLLTAFPVYYLFVEGSNKCMPSWYVKWKLKTYRYILDQFNLVPCVFMSTDDSSAAITSEELIELNSDH